MAHIVTLRLSDDEYSLISASAKVEHRPISNFIATATLKEIEVSHYTDAIEMAQIYSDKALMKELKTAHQDVRKKKGKFIE